MEAIMLALLTRPWLVVAALAAVVGGCLLVVYLADRNLIEIEEET